MKEECLICKAPLEYLETDVRMECEICHEDDKHGNYWIDKLPHDLTYTRKEKGKTS